MYFRVGSGESGSEQTAVRITTMMMMMMTKAFVKAGSSECGQDLKGSMSEHMNGLYRRCSGKDISSFQASASREWECGVAGMMLVTITHPTLSPAARPGSPPGTDPQDRARQHCRVRIKRRFQHVIDASEEILSLKNFRHFRPLQPGLVANC